jgi:hypothetical protein
MAVHRRPPARIEALAVRFTRADTHDVALKSASLTVKMPLVEPRLFVGVSRGPKSKRPNPSSIGRASFHVSTCLNSVVS